MTPLLGAAVARSWHDSSTQTLRQPDVPLLTCIFL